MSVITISAVNTGTDTLTAVAHGLLTGDRFRVRNVGGALPTGLTGAVDVFAVRVDADNLKVATSNANALAGTPVIDITGAGSGTNTIEYGLPCAIPNEIAVDGVSQVHAKDLNGSWNSLVALYDLLTGQAQSVWSTVSVAVAVTLAAGLKLLSSSGKGVTHQAPAGLAADYSVTWPSALPATKSCPVIDSAGVISTGGTAQYSASIGVPASGATVLNGGIALNTSTGVNALPLTLLTGTTITAWSVSILKQSTSGTVSAVLHRVAANGSGSDIGATDSNSANNPGAITLTKTVSQVVAAGEQYYIAVTGGGNAGDSIGAYSATS